MDHVVLNELNITWCSPDIFTNTSFEYYLCPLEALKEEWRTFLMVLYTITACLALIGNIIVIIVEIFENRTAINLRKFLINLAISDILFGVFTVPFSYTRFMLGRWIFAKWLCPITQFIMSLTVFITSSTLTLISIERYIAIIHPLSLKNQWFSSNCNIILTVGWIIATLFASPVLLTTYTVPFEWENSSHNDCRGPELEILYSKLYIGSSFLLSFAIPILIQLFSFVCIARKLLRNNMISREDSFRSNQSYCPNHHKIILMLVVVVIAFIICWLPIRCFILLVEFWPQFTYYYTVQEYYRYVISYFVCHWLAMSNSFINPIIYSFMSSSFRGDLKDMVQDILKKLRKK